MTNNLKINNYLLCAILGHSLNSLVNIVGFMSAEKL